MSNKTQLQTNNTALDGYIARINAAKEVAASLPEAGGGSGGGSGAGVETCTVTIQPFGWDPSSERIVSITATTIENGSRTTYRHEADYNNGTTSAITIPGVECGTTIHVLVQLYSIYGAYVETSGTMELVSLHNLLSGGGNYSYGNEIVFRAPTVANESSTLSFSYEP